MDALNLFQEEVLSAIATEQESAVQIAMCKYKDGDDIENLLYETTAEAIIGMMTLIDGYANDNIKLDIVDRKNGKRLKENPFIELHDNICDYLKLEK